MAAPLALNPLRCRLALPPPMSLITLQSLNYTLGHNLAEPLERQYGVSFSLALKAKGLA